jgi:aspartate kinase
MEQLRNAELILRLKNVFKPSGPGTVIYPSGRAPESPKSSTPAPSFMLANGYHGELQCRRHPTAVTIKESITLINVTCSRNTKSQGFLTSVFHQLERNTVAPDLVATSEMSVSLAIQSADDSKISSRLMSDLQKFGVVSISPQ